MSLDALSSNDLFNFIIYDTISATPNTSNNNVVPHHDSSENTFLSDDKCSKPNSRKRCTSEVEISNRVVVPLSTTTTTTTTTTQHGKKKRKRKAKVCKNKEEAETQRMTHIAVERTRRKQMNEHLSVLRSLMPESYVQRVCFLLLFVSFTFLFKFFKYITLC